MGGPDPSALRAPVCVSVSRASSCIGSVRRTGAVNLGGDSVIDGHCDSTGAAVTGGSPGCCSARSTAVSGLGPIPRDSDEFFWRSEPGSGDSVPPAGCNLCLSRDHGRRSSSVRVSVPTSGTDRERITRRAGRSGEDAGPGLRLVRRLSASSAGGRLGSWMEGAPAGAFVCGTCMSSSGSSDGVSGRDPSASGLSV